MENPNRSLLQINFEILTDSRIRQKLLNLALMKDRSHSHLAPYSCSRDRTDRSTSHRSNSKDRFSSHSPPPKKNLSQKIKNFVSDLLKAATSSKNFTGDLWRTFKLMNFESCSDNKFRVLEQELKCLRPGQSFTTALIGIIEDLAINLGLTSANKVKTLKKSGNHEKKLLEIVSWFTISRVKALPITRYDSDLFKSILTLVGKEFPRNSSLEVFKSICVNPGLGVKTLKSIVDLLKKGSIDKDLVEKAMSFYTATQKYTDVEGIQKLVEIVEELSFLFNVFPKDSHQVEFKKTEFLDFGKNLKTFNKVSQESQKDENIEYLVNKSAKALLLKNFRSKVSREKNEKDGYCSDNTDFSENESRKKTSRSIKMEKMFEESRFNQRTEKFIKSFFAQKVRECLLTQFTRSEGLNQRLEYAQKHTSAWINECISIFRSSNPADEGIDSLQELKNRVFFNKLTEPGYVDSIILEVIR